MDKRKQQIKDRLANISPWPWQESYFVDNRRYYRQSEEWKQAAREREAKMIRAAGQVGTPGCNPVGQMEFCFPYDKDFVLNAAPDLDFLLHETDKLEEDLLEAFLLIMQRDIYSAQLEQENIKLRRLLNSVRINAKKLQRSRRKS